MLTVPAFVLFMIAVRYSLTRNALWGTAGAVLALMGFLAYSLLAHGIAMRPLHSALQAIPFRCPICETSLPREDFRCHVFRIHPKERVLFRLGVLVFLGGPFYVVAATMFWMMTELFNLGPWQGGGIATLSLLITSWVIVAAILYIESRYVPGKVQEARWAYRVLGHNKLAEMVSRFALVSISEQATRLGDGGTHAPPPRGERVHWKGCFPFSLRSVESTSSIREMLTSRSGNAVLR